jgi:uncharacterized protein (DUF305 family)
MLAVALALAVAVAVGGYFSLVGSKPELNQHNNADITFAQRMITHHQQAVEMARLAPLRAGSQSVKQCASAIEAAQQPEIDQMTAMLKSWNAPVPLAGGDMSHMPGMSDMLGMGSGGMPGMMPGQDMAQLGQISGAAFDRRFLTMMISHHQGALTMAATELRDGLNPDAKALAQRITDSQSTQIGQLRGMLAGG